MKQSAVLTLSLFFVALISQPEVARAADLRGHWDVAVDDGTGMNTTIDFTMSVAQAIIFLDVIEERQTATGTVAGTGFSPGPLVLWTDDAGSVFLGRANHPRNPTAISGLFVLNFEALTFSSWTATKQPN